MRRGSRGRQRIGGFCAALWVLAAAGGGAPALAQETEIAAASPVPGGVDGPRLITLVTGDRVIADPARQRYEFRPAEGRAKMSYRSMAVDGHHYVIPGDAQVLAASGKLDMRLFDVTGLLAQGADIPLRVTRDDGVQREFVAVADAGRRWAELTEPSSMTGGARLGSRRLRAGIRAVSLDSAPLQKPHRTAAAEDFELTIVYRDRNGGSTVNAMTFLVGVADPVPTFIAPGPDGTATVRLKKGRYLVESVVDTPRRGAEVPAKSVIVNPDLSVEQDTRVEIDAAAARPVSVTVPDPKAVVSKVCLSYWRRLADGPALSSVCGADGTALFTSHDGPTMPDDELAAAVNAYFAQPGTDGTATNSPVTYATAWQRQGRIFTGFHKRVATSELSTVRAEHGTVAPGRHATKTTVLNLPPFAKFGHSIDYTTTPFTRIERYAGTVQWSNELTEYAPTENRDALTTQTQSPTTYRAARRSTERWNLAPFWPDAQVRRHGDTLLIRPALYSDQSGAREGISAYRQARVALYRDGHLIDESDQLDPNRFTVPAGTAGYRLTAEAERGFTELATKTSATWTFSSAHADGEAVTLPLLSVRYTPPVDLYGRAPGGRSAALPVHVEGVPGAVVRSLVVQTSRDGGTTWRPARVTGTGDHRVVLLDHLTGASLLSLRAKAADTRGNTVEHTIINAYRLI